MSRPELIPFLLVAVFLIVAGRVARRAWVAVIGFAVLFVLILLAAAARPG